MPILAAFLIGAITFTSLFSEYQPPDNGSPDGTIGSGTRLSECSYRGEDIRENCFQ